MTDLMTPTRSSDSAVNEAASFTPQTRYRDMSERLRLRSKRVSACRVRDCIEPTHLQAVTSRENTLRGEGATARNAVKTHCRYGHEYTPENTYTYRGHRYCRTCRGVGRTYR